MIIFNLTKGILYTVIYCNEMYGQGDLLIKASYMQLTPMSWYTGGEPAGCQFVLIKLITNTPFTLQTGFEPAQLMGIN